jgi:RNA polymerase sigma-70 factor, ECF subfamily
MPSDEALLEQLQRGDLRAFDTLYARYERHLFGFILKSLSDGDRAEAEDVLHDAFMAVLRESKTGRGVTCLRAWLFQVARNLCLNRVRSRQRTARAVRAATELPPSESGAPSHPERALEDRQAAEALRRAVSNLPGPLAELYHLRSSGLSYEEAATVLSIPLGTVKSRMHELVSRLREEVSR